MPLLTSNLLVPYPVHRRSLPICPLPEWLTDGHLMLYHRLSLPEYSRHHLIHRKLMILSIRLSGYDAKDVLLRLSRCADFMIKLNPLSNVSWLYVILIRYFYGYYYKNTNILLFIVDEDQ